MGGQTLVASPSALGLMRVIAWKSIKNINLFSCQLQIGAAGDSSTAAG